MGIITKLFGTHSQREIKLIMPLIKKIENLRESMMALSDEQLKEKTTEYKERYAKILEEYDPNDVAETTFTFNGWQW